MATLESLVRRVVTEYSDVAWAATAFVVTFVVAYVVGRLAVEPALGRVLAVRRVNETYRLATEKLLHALVVVASVAVALAVAGFGSVLNASATLVAAATLALGFAARDVLGNLVSGVFIVADPKFNVGDWIEWDDRAGVIDDISFRVTRVRTFDNKLVTVPNSELATTAVTNPVSTDLLRVAYSVEVAFDDPDPTVRVLEFTDDGVAVEALFWLRNPDRLDVMRVRSEYVAALKHRLTDADVSVSLASEHELSGDLGVRDADPS